MRLPAALAPLRHKLFRMLWTANLVVAMGVWMQNTGAGWLMTTLAPDALTVSLVQAATILPVFLLALPAGALADTIDKRLFIVGTQSWMLAAAALLAVLTFAGLTGAWSLLALTFAIGAGSAMNSPAWGSVMAEVVPRQDLAQAIALNSVGFNLARAIGPAIAGFLVLAGGPALTFALNAASYLAVIGALLSWHRRRRTPPLPREHVLAAMRAGMRFVRHTPAMQAAMIRSAAFYFAASAPWAMLPLIVRQQLQLGAGTYGLMLGLMGTGGVTAGILLPQIRAYLSRGNTVFVSSLLSFCGMAILAMSRHWLPAAVGMLLFGIGWVAASAVTQGVAQLASPGWVRSRALAIFQLAFNGALVLGTFFWGWLGTVAGLTPALLAAAGTGLAMAVVARLSNLDQERILSTGQGAEPPPPEEVAPELLPVLQQARHQVLESQSYIVAPNNQADFLAVMGEVREVRSRAGALGWHLYEDISHPDGWLEVWSVENWTDHLRERTRLSGADRAILGRALALHEGRKLPISRYVAIPPHRLVPPERS